MAFTPFSYDMDIVTKLSDTPNVDDGLTAFQLKEKFDEGGKAIKNYINNTLLQEAVERPSDTGLLKAVDGDLVAAEAGVDYQAPIEAGEITADMLSDGAITAGRLLFSNVSVAVSTFADDATYADFPYRASVSLAGVTAGMVPEVVFGVADAMSGIFAPVAESYDGGVYIYSSEVPAASITIPVIILWR